MKIHQYWVGGLHGESEEHLHTVLGNSILPEVVNHHLIMKPLELNKYQQYKATVAQEEG